MTEIKKIFKAKFYSFRDNGTCLADVELPTTGRVIWGVRVAFQQDKVLCEPPPGLAGRWHFEEMRWEEVAEQTAAAYLNMQNAVAKTVKAVPTDKYKLLHRENVDLQPTFVFSNIERKKGMLADVLFGDCPKALKGVFVQLNMADGVIYVATPSMLENAQSFDDEKWEQTEKAIKTAFRKQILGEPLEQVTDVQVTFREEEDFLVCTGDVLLYDDQTPFQGFKLKWFQNGRVEVTPPASIGIWNHPLYSWLDLRADFARALKKELRKEGALADEVLRLPKKPAQRNRYGRIMNADSSDFVYYPHSMLRPDTKIEEVNEKRMLNLLATALTKGAKSGIGPFEINALWWVSKLRYVTNTMLSDLAAHGYISLGWRDVRAFPKMKDITKRMQEYNMITKSRFCCVDENGEEYGDSKSVSRILTLAPNGSILLKELGKEANRYDPFTLLQDGNTVKRYLVANQWLIYWLTEYKDRIGENYESAALLQRKGEEFSLARIYACVTVDDVTMVAESVRRVDAFEAKENKRFLLDKLERIIDMFDHLDQLYCSNVKMNFSSRPIIVLLCEDDAHAKETMETVAQLAEENPAQEFWFSTDLRVFNAAYIGQRFLKAVNGALEVVDIAAYLGCDDEVEQAKLMEKFAVSDTDGEFEEDDLDYEDTGDAL